jgi:predicted transcriptional regulator
MNEKDEDRSARSQVTLRLDRDLLDKIDGLATEAGVDRTELVRRLLAEGLAHRRVEMALVDYAAGKRSAWSASQVAGVDLYEMLDRIAEAGVPYRLDPDALDRLRPGKGSPPSGSPPKRSRPPRTASSAEPSIAALRARYRPATTRLLFVGESSPAGGTHFYRADSNLYRATREAFGAAFSMADPPEGDAFLAWFQELGCWLVDLADHAVNRSSAGDRVRAVDAGMPALADTIRLTEPARILVVLRRIAPAVRRAARLAEFDDRAIDVLPFPTRQWRPVYVDQLAGIVADVLGAKSPTARSSAGDSPSTRTAAIAERSSEYGSRPLHDVIADVIRSHGNAWMKPGAIAREIADGDLWRRPSDGRHPLPSQISARARSRSYAGLFQTSDLGIRLRAS